MNINRLLSIPKSLIYVYYTIKTCNYTKTAEILGTQQSNVSRIIHDFEKELGVKLFSKVSHGVVPTEEGMCIYNYAVKQFALVTDVMGYSTKAHSISGKIKVWTTDGIAICMTPHLAEFYRKYPDVSMDLICSNETPNMAARDADVAVVYHMPKKGEPVHFTKHDVKFGLFASPDYIARYNIPKDMKDLTENHFICDRREYQKEWKEWDEIIGQTNHVIAVSNSSNLLIEFNKEGLGISLHPLKSGRIRKDLIQVVPEFELQHPYWVVSHVDAKQTEKVQMLAEFLNTIINQL